MADDLVLRIIRAAQPRLKTLAKNPIQGKDCDMKKKSGMSTEAAELRRQAETWLSKHKPAGQSVRLGDSVVLREDEDKQRLIHELEVHRIELEMQNDELARAHTEQELLLKKYTDLFDFAPVGYVTLSEKGLVLEANLTATTLLGVARSALIHQPFSRFIIKEDQDINYLHFKQLRETGEPQSYELKMAKNNGTTRVRWVQIEMTVTQDEAGEMVFRVILSDDPERKRSEEYKEIGWEIQQILNEPGDLQSSLQRVISALKARTGFDALGIRLQDGDDFPYFVQQDFTNEFLQKNNPLIERGVSGGICRDKDGNISLECICGLVISGKADPANPFFTAAGSSWTNNLFASPELPPNEDPWLYSRNRCIYQGYASVALVPIRITDRNIGLIQINDRRKGCFSLATIEFMEGIATQIGKTLMRKQAEDLLKKSEQKLRNIIHGTNAGTWEWNVQTGETSFDENSVAILGYSLDEFQPITFEKWMGLKHPEDMQASSELLEKHLQGKTDYYSFESKMKHKDGHWVWVLGQGVVVEWDKNGKPLWMSGMHIDITERKRGEESLRESEKRYRTLVDTSPDAIFYISPGMQVILCNQRAAELYGVENPGQMHGMSAFNLFGPANNLWISRDIVSIPKGWSVRGQEFTLNRQDGSHFPAEVEASLVVNEMDEPIGIISVVRDITQRKQLEQYLLRSERLAAMGKVSAELAHEIKNPLQSIQSNLELLLDFALDPHESQEHLQLCYNELERLVVLTNRLLNLSDPNKTFSQPFSVSELFKRILDLVEKSAWEAGVNINLIVPNGFPLILIDIDQMIQVLLNLSINAIEAMPHGGQLTISAEAADESIRLSVINDGNITPASRLENIFEFFYTTKIRGSGLGLPISFNIIQKMGGSLSAVNLQEPDRVQFSISLPASICTNGQEQSS